MLVDEVKVEVLVVLLLLIVDEALEVEDVQLGVVEEDLKNWMLTSWSRS